MAVSLNLIQSPASALSAYTKAVGQTAMRVTYHDDITHGIRRIRIKATDLIKIYTDTFGAAATFAQNDVISVLPIKKGELAQAVMTWSLVADGNAAVYQVGDTGTAAGWQGAGAPALNSAGVGVTPAMAGTTGGFLIGAASGNLGTVGKLYTADDAVILKLTGTGATLPTTGGTTNWVLEIALKYIPAFPDANASVAHL